MYSVSFKYNGLEKSESILEREADDVEVRLKKKLVAKHGLIDDDKTREALRKSFINFDANGNGRVSLQEFIRAMAVHSFVDMDDVLEVVFHKYDVDDSGSLEYDEFCKGLYGLIPIPGASKECRELCRRITLSLKANRGSRNLVITLRGMDNDGNGLLDRSEIYAGLSSCGVDLTERELDTIGHYFDRNGDGRISISEFSHTLRGDINMWRTQMVKLAFLQVDTNDSGGISFTEMREAFRADLHPDVVSGQYTEQEIVDEFIQSWVKDPDEEISEMEFLDYYKDISLAIPNDEAFTTLVKQTWKPRQPIVPPSDIPVRITHEDGSTETVTIEREALSLNYTKRSIEVHLRRQGYADIAKIRVLEP
eukprot:TRINITY_DN13066_c0_g1_i2.p1 TRINITY_DN13066_c0_g1~~TRINITY_DN13066_c0_g1_i2.p1  ORF type:complete len:365 (+),score=99.11 TRINITY_DN13066_c0_g1_i2:71-1165(+)